MIAHLRGDLIHRDGARGIVDVQGVGYEVFAPEHALDTWNSSDTPISVHVFTQVREDAITLYGFPSPVLREAFVTMLAVKGVGPKVALSCLDVLRLEALVQAVATDDIRTLSKAKGVGKRLAERMALELKNKLPSSFQALDSAASPRPTHRADTMDLALEQLGFRKAEIAAVKTQLAESGVTPDLPVSDRLRAALRLLHGNKS